VRTYDSVSQGVGNTPAVFYRDTWVDISWAYFGGASAGFDAHAFVYGGYAAYTSIQRVFENGREYYLAIKGYPVIENPWTRIV
jgi:hypothetical protein